MADILHPVIDMGEILAPVVAQAIERGMSEEDVRLWLGSIARDEYRKEQERRARERS